MKSLIVEDDLVTRTILVKTLSECGKCDVADTGEKAAKALYEALQIGAPYELICLDVMLPDMSGLDVLRLLRENEERFGVFALSGAKVIMTTSRTDSATILSAFREGCEAYLQKPFARKDLLQMVGKLCPSPG